MRILHAARFAKLAYAEGRSEFDHSAKTLCKTMHLDLQAGILYEPAAGPNQAYVLTTEDLVICGVRGTDFLDAQSAWQNFKTRRLDVAGLSIHEGYFLGTMELIKRGLMTRIKSQLDGRRLVLVGHSAGGAIADVLSGQLWMEAVRPHRLATFGAPRVSGKVRAVLQRRRYSGDEHKYARVVACNDPAPWALLACRGWRHSYPATYINRNNERVRSASTAYMAWDALCDRVKQRRVFIGKEAHGIDNYIRRLENSP